MSQIKSHLQSPRTKHNQSTEGLREEHIGQNNIINKMLTYKLYLCVLILGCAGSINGKVCNDCVAFTSCPSAAELAVNHRDATTKTKFIESFCGYEYDQLKRIPKVCCSDFNVASRTGEAGTDVTGTANPHPNMKLLPDICGDIDGNRIIGGRVAKIHEFPWMALISYNTREGLQFLCGGSIINSRYILTAGHCVAGSQKIAGVRIGEFDIRYKTDCQGEEPNFVCESHLQDIRVEKVILHESYTGLPAPSNDIALLRLSKPINLSYKNALPICLPVTEDLQNVELGGRVGTVAGWGLTETEKYSPVLLKVNVSIRTGEECTHYYNRSPGTKENDRTTNYLCAGEYLKDSCNGDSGGPLMLEGEYKGINRNIQYGIVSHGPKQCGSDFPGVYTAVTKYIGWILDNIRE
ncbi:CLIP domain-containing serine protease HP8 [Danaus plexippus]|uniref:CLIP domain-containing serine protease HP8 n=1 Tax=Danaus plexippus TaxID=13037 RepID=UPI002AB07BA7|nr:CLIP domain-containing serine protease HP8 [Danaus plexippus]